MCAHWQHSLHSAERELISALRSAILCWETWHNRKLHRRHSYKYCAHTHAHTLTRLRAVLSFIIIASMREDAGCFNEAKCSLFSWLKMREGNVWLLFSLREPSRNCLYFNFLLMELSSKVDVCNTCMNESIFAVGTLFFFFSCWTVQTVPLCAFASGPSWFFRTAARWNIYSDI